MSATQKDECWHCARNHAMKEAGVQKALHVCWAHARWRMTISTVPGHSDDCPLSENYKKA